MQRFILFAYLTLNVFMSSTLTVTACNRNVDNIQFISDFLLHHESGEFKEYAELVKKENNINAKNSEHYNASALHKGMC
jgi:hypothetical protein